LPLEFAIGSTTKVRLLPGTNVGGLFGFTIRPGAVVLRYPLAPGTSPPAARLGFSIAFAPTSPAILPGDSQATRLELKEAELRLEAATEGTNTSLTVGADLKGLNLVIAAGEGDGFLRTLLGDQPAAIAIPLGLEWSQAHGLRFTGS